MRQVDEERHACVDEVPHFDPGVLGPPRARVAPGDEATVLDDGGRTHDGEVCRRPATPSGGSVSFGGERVPIAVAWRRLDTSATELRDRALAPRDRARRRPRSVVRPRARGGAEGGPRARSRGARASVLGAPARDRTCRSPGHLARRSRTSSGPAKRPEAQHLGLESRRPTTAVRWPSRGRSAFRPPPRPLGVLDPRRGVPDPGPRREGGAARDARRLAHGPRLARRRGAALPGGAGRSA